MSDPTPTPRETTVTLSTCPVDALMGGILVTGCEREGSGDVRLYIGPRYHNEYVVFPAGADADAAERAWDATHSSHLWLVER